MAIRTRDLMKVADHPDVRAAIEARDAALEACRQAHRAQRDADVAFEQRVAELETVARRVLGADDDSTEEEA